MELKHSLTQGLRQTLQMTPQIIAALELLELPIQELELRIKEEVEQNPVLEFEEDTDEDLDATLPTADAAQEPYAEPDRDREREQERDAAREREEVDWTDYMNDDLDTPTYGGMEYDPSAEFYERVPVATIGLAEHLTAQLHLAFSNEKQIEIGEFIIGCLDERGYLTSAPEEIAGDLGVPVEEVENVLRVVRTFEPAGVGARDLRDCLLLQLDAAGESETLAARIIRERFSELTERRYPEIARALKVPVDAVQAAADAIARLNPKPGLAYASEDPKYVIPDLIVERVGERYMIAVNDRNLPRLRISSTYENVLRDGDAKNAKTRDFVKERLSSARWLIGTIEQRRKTMVKVMECIVDIQHEFFEKGISALKPLTLQQVAQQVQVHESTVSRVTKGKYVQTPRGVFELKFFFSGGITTDQGEDVSAKAVKQEIARMVAEEDPHHPLSDQQIADRLKDAGLVIARRTVAKYRDQLRILPARQRRRYDTVGVAANGSNGAVDLEEA
jgi:RNA polymerase sigma-54 factor